MCYYFAEATLLKNTIVLPLKGLNWLFSFAQIDETCKFTLRMHCIMPAEALLPSCRFLAGDAHLSRNKGVL